MQRKNHWGWIIAFEVLTLAILGGLLLAGVSGQLLSIIIGGIVCVQLLAAILTGKQSNDGMQ